MFMLNDNIVIEYKCFFPLRQSVIDLSLLVLHPLLSRLDLGLRLLPLIIYYYKDQYARSRCLHHVEKSLTI